MNILCIGDIVGRPGRDAVCGLINDLKKEYAVDFVVANAENVAGGAGINARLAKQLLTSGCHVLTLGDHTWDQKEIDEYLNSTDEVIRPANFPEGAPGRGWTIQKTASGAKVGVINLLGRVFMRHQVECPFRQAQKIIEQVRRETPIVVLDMHAEATSEKVALGHFLDGQVSIIFGTHTHIQTADEKILKQGTAYITDLGMTGPYDSVIGQNKQEIIQRFLSSLPIKFHVAEDEVKLHGIVVEVDPKTGKARRITRIQRAFEDRTGNSNADDT